MLRLLLGALLIHMVGGQIHPRPSRAGKLATFFQVATVLGGLTERAFGVRLGLTPVLWLAAGFTVVSGLQYIVQGMRFLNAAPVTEGEADEASLLR